MDARGKPNYPTGGGRRMHMRLTPMTGGFTPPFSGSTEST